MTNDVLELRDGSVETILDFEDFESLVEKYMGDEAREYLKRKIEYLEEEGDYTQASLDTELTEYETTLESNTACFSDIYDIASEMSTLLDAKRMDRKRMRELVWRVKNELSNQI